MNPNPSYNQQQPQQNWGQPQQPSQPWGNQGLTNGRKVVIRTLCSGRALDISQTNDHGNKIGDLIVYDYYNAPNQQFLLCQEGPDVVFKSVKSGKVLEVQGGAKENERRVSEGQWSNQPHQKWRLQEKVAGSSNYYIYNSNSGKVLDVSGAHAKNCDKVIQYDFHGNSNQVWNFEYLS